MLFGVLLRVVEHFIGIDISREAHSTLECIQPLLRVQLNIHSRGLYVDLGRSNKRKSGNPINGNSSTVVLRQIDSAEW